MISVIKQWRVTASWFLPPREITFRVNDNHLSNVFRKLAEFQFDYDPDKLEIKSVVQDPQVGSSHT